MLRFSALALLLAVACLTSGHKIKLIDIETIELTTTGVPEALEDEPIQRAQIVCNQLIPENSNFASFGCPRNATPILPTTKPAPTPAPQDPDFSIYDEFRPNDTPDVSTVISKKRTTCLCGVPNKQQQMEGALSEVFNERIVGGVPAKIVDYPWTVGLLRQGFFGFGGSSKPFCGGTLINDRYVVTASHCVDGQIARNIQVLVNEEDLTTTNEANTTKYQVERIIMHPAYDRSSIDNDIALIKLATPIQFDVEGAVRPVCLPAVNTNDFSGLNATTCGWGTTTQGGSQSKHLLKVDVPVITNDVCNGAETKYQGKITANMLCAGNVKEGGQDACQGDSGGPLIIENGGRRTLVGVVSWGYGCAQPKSPGVYTRVARYPEWILTNTQGAEWCG